MVFISWYKSKVADDSIIGERDRRAVVQVPKAIGELETRDRRALMTMCGDVNQCIKPAGKCQ